MGLSKEALPINAVLGLGRLALERRMLYPQDPLERRGGNGDSSWDTLAPSLGQKRDLFQLIGELESLLVRKGTKTSA